MKPHSFDEHMGAFRTQLDSFRNGTAKDIGTVNKLNSYATDLRYNAQREGIHTQPIKMTEMKQIFADAIEAVTQWNTENAGVRQDANVRQIVTAVEFCDDHLRRSAAADREGVYARR